MDAVAALKASNASDDVLIRALAESSAASLITDVDQRVIFANAAFAALTGYPVAEMMGRTCSVLQGIGTDLAAVAAIRDALIDGREFRGEILNYRRDGSAFWNLLAVTPVRDGSGVVINYTSVQLDVTEQVRDRETTHRLLDTARALGATSTVEEVSARVAEAVLLLSDVDRSAVGLWDRTARIMKITAAAGGPFGPPAEARPTTFRAEDALELVDLARTPRPLLVKHRGASEWAKRQLDTFDLSAVGAFPVVLHGEVLAFLLVEWGPGQAPETLSDTLRERMAGLAGLCAVALDNVRLLEEARHASERDPLTSLATRVVLDRGLVRALTSAGPHDLTAVIYADIDRFKLTNDRLGHRAGDRVLTEIARRIRLSVRADDLIARPGGDEFVIVLPGVRDIGEVHSVIDRLSGIMAPPVLVEGEEVQVSMSVGTALRGRPLAGESPSAVADAMLREADTAMYEAKRRDRNGRSRSSFPLDDGLTADLEVAADRDELVARFQPIRDVATSRIVAAEGLVRWRHPRLGELPPVAFIELAERSGAIRSIGEFMLREACELVRRSDDTSSPVSVAVNVSGSELADREFLYGFLDGLTAYDCPAERMSVEVTESMLMSDPPRVIDVLRRLRGRGVDVSIDDFGTGYSSLAQLQDLPATELKIDRAFVHREGEIGLSFMTTIVQLAHRLGLRVVAEGVETAEQFADVRAAGCDRAQGYLLGRPMDADDFIDLLSREGSTGV